MALPKSSSLGAKRPLEPGTSVGGSLTHGPSVALRLPLPLAKAFQTSNTVIASAAKQSIRQLAGPDGLLRRLRLLAMTVEDGGCERAPPASGGRGKTTPAASATRSAGLLVALLAAGLPLAACKLVKNEPPQVASAAEAGSVATSFDNPAFDPEKKVEEIWQPKLLPYLHGKAGPFAEVRQAVQSNPDEAGKRFGYRAVESMPWTVAATIEGKITAADTGTRAATIDVDADGDGTADLTVQIGPVFKGTALRDSLDFISFNSFANQIEYAKFGKALNAHIYDTTLAALPRDKLVGRTVTLLGVFTLDDPKTKPLVTPAELGLGEATP